MPPSEENSPGGIFLFASRIGFLFVCQTCQVIHTRVQCDSNPFALLKRIISLSAFYLGIIALIDACKHLHHDLSIAAFFA